jgi:hypothetical protein
MVLLAPTLQVLGYQGLLFDVEALHLDKGYDNGSHSRLRDRHALMISCARTSQAGRPETGRVAIEERVAHPGAALACRADELVVHELGSAST